MGSWSTETRVGIVDSWGIDSTVFWWCWAIAFVPVVCAYLWAQRDTPPSPDSSGGGAGSAPPVYELAYLNGGAHLAITAAAAKRHQAPDAVAEDEFERFLLGALRDAPGDTAVHDLRHRIAESQEMGRLDAKLMAAGDLRAPRLAALEYWSFSAGFTLMTLALVRQAAEAPIDLTTELVLDAMFVGAWLILLRGGNVHRLTPQGRSRVERARRIDSAGELRRPHAHSDLPLAVALFGGGVLWHADPAFAAAWEIPREDCPTGVAAARGGCGGGTCSDGTYSCSCG
jgi:uncharacterized protein (TIGR04222 family)